MNSTLQDQLFGIFLHGLLDALLRYGLPALTLCALLSWISARLTRKRRRQRLPKHAPPPRHVPAPRHTPPPLDTVPVTPRRPLTAFEQQMFAALTAALPECVVLAQVAFSALITTEQRSHRNRFDRKVADFVICSRQLTPFAIIELDDPSHRGREAADAQRDTMLRNAGYHTLRYQGIPPADRIRRDIEALLAKLTAVAPPPAGALDPDRFNAAV
jgi:very-short-patch-repair endonuclease